MALNFVIPVRYSKYSSETMGEFNNVVPASDDLLNTQDYELSCSKYYPSRMLSKFRVCNYPFVTVMPKIFSFGFLGGTGVIRCSWGTWWRSWLRHCA